MYKSLFVFLVVISNLSEAGLVTYRYQVAIDAAFGSLDAGTVLTGEFTYNSQQSGTDIPGLPNAQRFELSALSLSDGNESIELNFASGTDQWMVVGDDSPVFPKTDFLTVRAEGGPAFTGTLGGLPVYDLYLYWEDTDGTANDGFSLPLDDSTFSAYENTAAQILGSSGTNRADGTISDVSSVPLGDMNGDGIVNLGDLLLLQRQILGH